MLEILSKQHSYVSDLDILSCRCSKCGNIVEMSVREGESLAGKKCPSCKAKYDKEAEDRRVVYNGRIRLKGLYDRLSSNHSYKMCDDWKDSCDNFIKWATENGYRTWKTFHVHEKELPLSPDNCCWKVEKIGSIGLFDDSNVMSLKYLKRAVTLSNNIGNNLDELFNVLSQMKNGTKYNSTEPIADCVDSILNEMYYLKGELDSQIDMIELREVYNLGKKS